MTRLHAGGASAVVVSLVLVVVPPAPAQVDASCPQPWTPIDEWNGSPADPPPDLEVAWTGELLFDPSRWNTEDLDGDGTDDVRVAGDRVRIKRPGGDVVVTVPGARLAAVGLADLDGDGGREVGVVEYDDAPDATGVARGSWLVPWDAPDGEFDPSAVGVALPVGWPWALDDRDGDGVDELLISTSWWVGGAQTTTMLSGAAVLAGGAPADLSSSTGLWQVPGIASWVGSLGGPIPAILVIDVPSELPGHATVRVVEQDVIAVLQTERLDETVPQTASGGTGPAGRFVRADLDPVRPPGHTWLWSLDDPCRQLDPAPAPPPTTSPAPPASPTGTQPTYTG